MTTVVAAVVVVAALAATGTMTKAVTITKMAEAEEMLVAMVAVTTTMKTSHSRSQPWYFWHNNIKDIIDVIVFTLSAPVQHIQGHALHPFIMIDASVP